MASNIPSSSENQGDFFRLLGEARRVCLNMMGNPNLTTISDEDKAALSNFLWVDIPRAFENRQLLDNGRMEGIIKIISAGLNEIKGIRGFAYNLIQLNEIISDRALNFRTNSAQVTEEAQPTEVQNPSTSMMISRRHSAQSHKKDVLEVQSKNLDQIMNSSDVSPKKDSDQKLEEVLSSQLNEEGTFSTNQIEESQNSDLDREDSREDWIETTLIQDEDGIESSRKTPGKIFGANIKKALSSYKKDVSPKQDSDQKLEEILSSQLSEEGTFSTNQISTNQIEESQNSDLDREDSREDWIETTLIQDEDGIESSRKTPGKIFGANIKKALSSYKKDVSPKQDSDQKLEEILSSQLSEEGTFSTNQISTNQIEESQNSDLDREDSKEDWIETTLIQDEDGIESSRKILEEAFEENVARALWGYNFQLDFFKELGGNEDLLGRLRSINIEDFLQVTASEAFRDSLPLNQRELNTINGSLRELTITPLFEQLINEIKEVTDLVAIRALQEFNAILGRAQSLYTALETFLVNSNEDALLQTLGNLGIRNWITQELENAYENGESINTEKLMSFIEVLTNECTDFLEVNDLVSTILRISGLANFNARAQERPNVVTTMSSLLDSQEAMQPRRNS